MNGLELGIELPHGLWGEAIIEDPQKDSSGLVRTWDVETSWVSSQVRCFLQSLLPWPTDMEPTDALEAVRHHLEKANNAAPGGYSLFTDPDENIEFLRFLMDGVPLAFVAPSSVSVLSGAFEQKPVFYDGQCGFYAVLMGRQTNKAWEVHYTSPSGNTDLVFLCPNPPDGQWYVFGRVSDRTIGALEPWEPSRPLNHMASQEHRGLDEGLFQFRSGGNEENGDVPPDCVL